MHERRRQQQSYHAGAGLSSSGAPQTGSPALGAGTNLTSLCTGNLTALCTTYTGPQSTSAAGSTTNGTTRPTHRRLERRRLLRQPAYRHWVRVLHGTRARRR